jgi:hypothetical protein
MTKIELSPEDQQLLDHVKELRKFYPPKNRVGKHLDALATDLSKGKRGKHSKKVMEESMKLLQEELGPTSTASRAIRAVIGRSD